MTSGTTTNQAGSSKQEECCGCHLEGQRLKFIDPMLPTLVDEAPEGNDWLHEVK